jgi:rubrerythrin
MNWKLFVSTFILIFLAELGDKTQLAAMARTASSGGAKWIVFTAASSALVFSTLVAVLFGHILTKFVPEHIIKLAAGGLFIIFGALIIRQALTTEKPVVTQRAPGPLASTVLKWAAEFERAAADDYDTMAATTTDPDLRALLSQLATEEREHLAEMTRAASEHRALKLPVEKEKLPLPDRVDLGHEAVVAKDSAVVRQAIEHEEVTARFYLELARLTPLPSLRETFTALAEAEKDHAARLAGRITPTRGQADA